MIYVSWNGDTNVTTWKVSSGASPTALAPVQAARRNGFETAIRIGAAKYVKVAGVDSHGNVLGTSSVVSAG